MVYKVILYFDSMLWYMLECMFDDSVYIVYIKILERIDIFLKQFTKKYTILVHNYSLIHLKILVYCVHFLPCAILCHVPFCACAVMFCAVLSMCRFVLVQFRDVPFCMCISEH
jgi:hypothetical protein